MEDLLAFLVRALVDQPEQVSVESAEEPDGLVLELRVADSDVGKVIGRRGRTIDAVRTVVRACSPDGRRVFVDVVD